MKIVFKRQRYKDGVLVGVVERFNISLATLQQCITSALEEGCEYVSCVREGDVCYSIWKKDT